MTVIRNSEALDLRPQDTRRASSAQVSDARMPNTGGGSHTAAWRDSVLASLLGTVTNVAKVADDTARVDAYLAGQNAAALGESEDSLESNVFTRDWAVAGHRDATGRLKIAEVQAQFASDLQKLREQPPEALRSYLAQKRGELLPNIEGMSREQRAATVAALSTFEKTAVTQHNQARTKWIVEQELTSIQTVLQAHTKTLKTYQEQAAIGQIPPEMYHDAAANAKEALIGAVMMNKRLPQEAKAKAVASMMTQLLESDQIGLYEAMRDTRIDQNGTTMFSMLDADDATRLIGKHREAESRTKALRNSAENANVATLEFQLEQGEVTMSDQSFMEQLRSWKVGGVITPEMERSLIQKHLKAKATSADGVGAVAALVSGNSNYLAARGMSAGDAIKQYDKLVAKVGLPLKQQITDMLSAGRNGMAEGYKRVGELIAPAVGALVQADGTINQDHKATLEQFFQHIGSLAGQDAAISSIYAGMSQEQAARLSGIHNFVRKEKLSYEEATAKQLEVEKHNNSMDAARRAGVATHKLAEVSKIVSGYDTQGLLGSVWNKVAGIFSTDRELKSHLEPYANWFTNNSRKDEYVGAVRAALESEAANVLRARPFMDVEDAVRVAGATVAARTVMTSQAPIIVPENMTPQQLFGTNESNETIGHALSKLPVAKGGRVAYSMLNRRMLRREFDEDGVPTGPAMEITPEVVREQIRKLSEERHGKMSRLHGAGTAVSVAPDTKLRINGANTGGVNSQWMYEYREMLLKPTSEGWLPNVTPINGVPTIGPGLTQSYMPKTDQSGKANIADIEANYAKATDDAAKAGLAAAESVGLGGNKAAFLLLSEFAYQSGPGFMKFKSYAEFANALRSGDKQKVVEAFKGTLAYKYSGRHRNKHYLDLINQI